MSKHSFKGDIRQTRVTHRISSTWASLLTPKSEKHHKNWWSTRTLSVPMRSWTGWQRKVREVWEFHQSLAHRLTQAEDRLLPGSFPHKPSSVYTWPPQTSAVYYAKLPAHQVHVKSLCKKNYTLPGLFSALLVNTDWSRTKSFSSSQWWARAARLA